MDLNEAVEALGLIAALCALGALSNLLLKEISRTFIKNLPRKYAEFASAYRSFMRFMVRRHRYFGLASFFFVLVHAFTAIAGSALSVTGLIGAAALTGTVCLGIYGFYIEKSLRSAWLQVHRTFAFILLVAVTVHFFFRIPVTL